MKKFQPVFARTRTYHRPTGPVIHDCVVVSVIRDGSAILFSEFGQQAVSVGSVVVLSANTLCCCEPEEQVTFTTVYLDAEYVIDQVFWQYSDRLRDRLYAERLAAHVYTEPTQILRLGEDRAGTLFPWLDELASLSADDSPTDHFYRTQALWFSIAHVVAPHVKTSPLRNSATQRASSWLTSPRHRRFAPLRSEAHRAAELLRANPERRWSVGDLAEAVHLSKSQIGRVFVDAPSRRWSACSMKRSGTG